MPKVFCKKCGTKCCSCEGCDTKKYVNGICPLCQKLENNVKSEDNRVPELSKSTRVTSAGGLQFAELSS